MLDRTKISFESDVAQAQTNISGYHHACDFRFVDFCPKFSDRGKSVRVCTGLERSRIQKNVQTIPPEIKFRNFW